MIFALLLISLFVPLAVVIFSLCIAANNNSKLIEDELLNEFKDI